MSDEFDIIKKEVSANRTLLKGLNERIILIEKRLGMVQKKPEPETKQTEQVVEQKEASLKPKQRSIENPTNLFRVFGIIGTVMIVLGVIYFYKYAVDHGWIGITGRIAIGILASFIFIGFGLFMYKKQYYNYSQIINGCGLGILYFTFFATYHFKEYRNALGMSLTLNTILLLVVMVGGTFLGIRLNGRYVVYGSLLLGYAAAFLSGIEGSTLHILIYILLINLVILSIAKVKSWYFGIPAQVLTYIAYFIWFLQGIDDPHSILSQTSSPVFMTFAFLLAYYLVFTVFSFIQSSGIKEVENIAISVINTICLSGFSYGIITKYYPDFNGIYLMATAGLTIFVGYLAKQKSFEKTFDVHFLLTCVLVAIAVPAQFDYTIVTVLWVLMALGLAYAGLRMQHEALFLVGYIGYLIPLGRVLFYDLWFLDSFIERFIAIGACIVGVFFLQKIAAIYREQNQRRYAPFTLIPLAAILITVVWIARECVDLFSENATALIAISIIWAIFAIGLIFYGVLNHKKIFNWAGVILFGIVILKILIIDLREVENIFRVIALVGVGALALVGSFVFVRNKEKIKEFV